MPFERPHDVPLGMPSPEALRLATAVISRRYVLPETMQHPQVRSECMRLAYLIQAYGLVAQQSSCPTSSPDPSTLKMAADGVEVRSWTEAPTRTIHGRVHPFGEVMRAKLHIVVPRNRKALASAGPW
jgi:hypothetical protein